MRVRAFSNSKNGCQHKGFVWEFRQKNREVNTRSALPYLFSVFLLPVWLFSRREVLSLLVETRDKGNR